MRGAWQVPESWVRTAIPSSRPNDVAGATSQAGRVHARVPLQSTRTREARMRIVVTGGSGRVGRAIHIRLSASHEVAGLDRNPSSTRSCTPRRCMRPPSATYLAAGSSATCDGRARLAPALRFRRGAGPVRCGIRRGAAAGPDVALDPGRISAARSPVAVATPERTRADRRHSAPPEFRAGRRRACRHARCRRPAA